MGKGLPHGAQDSLFRFLQLPGREENGLETSDGSRLQRILNQGMKACEPNRGLIDNGPWNLGSETWL